MEFNYFRISTGTLIGIGVAVACSGVLGIVLHRRNGVSTSRSFWIAASAASGAAVLFITLSPGRFGGTFPCEFSGSVFSFLGGNQSTANVAMLVPVAIALPLAASGTAFFRWSFVVLIALPILIEATQATVPLGRACDGLDVVHNWIGVAIGVLIGWAGTRLVARRRRRPSVA